MSGVTVRPVEPSDETALAELSADVSDGGPVGYTVRQLRPLLRSVAPDSHGYVATSAAGRVVGAAWVTFGSCQLGGRRTTYGLLHSLAVHPDARRRGVARALTHARLAVVDDRPEPTVAMATIQRGNDASFANAWTWATIITGDLCVTPVPSPRRAPRSRPQWQVRPSEADDLPALAAILDREGLALSGDAATLDQWQRREVAGARTNHYYVVVEDGTVLAGLGVHDDTAITETHVVRMPRTIAAANRVVRVVDRDGTMRSAQATLVTCRSVEAGRHLWQSVRWLWRERVGSLIVTADVRDPARAMMPAPRLLPSTGISLALRPPAEGDGGSTWTGRFACRSSPQ